MCEFSKRDKCLHDLMELYHFLSRKIDILMFEEEWWHECFYFHYLKIFDILMFCWP